MKPLLVVFLVLAPGLFGCKPAANPPATGKTVMPLAVKLVRPTRGEMVRYVTLPGALRANEQVTLYAKVAGYLKSLSVDKGDRVQAGQVLGEIEVPELRADLAKYRAEVEVAEADFERIRAAQRKAPDLVTPQSVDEARGRLQIARANLERTETLLRYARITAPFAGIVTARFVDPGAFIPAATSGSAAQTAAIVTIADFDTVRVQVAVPEAETPLVRIGQPVKICVEGPTGKTFRATVSRLSYALEETTRTMLVEADLLNPDFALRPGMYATVSLGLEKHADALRLPVEAVAMEKNNAFAFVVSGGRAKKIPLQIGFNDGTHVEVLGGLTENEPVILLGGMPLSDGVAVNATEVR